MYADQPKQRLIASGVSLLLLDCYSPEMVCLRIAAFRICSQMLGPKAGEHSVIREKSVANVRFDPRASALISGKIFSFGCQISFIAAKQS